MTEADQITESSEVPPELWPLMLRIKELEEALMPFAALADVAPYAGYDALMYAKMGDCRRARDVLNKGKPSDA